MNNTEFIARLEADRTIAVVRAPDIADAAELCRALVAGGISGVELTYTTPNLLKHVARAADTAAEHGAVVGVGTVLTADQAKAAIDAGAQFLVTPGIRPEVARVAADAGIPFSLGALTPTEVAMALDLGSAVVKIFPASAMGAAYLKDLQGPYSGIKLLPSGGINAANAQDFLAAGALAVCCGTAVVPPAVVAAGTWADITERAAAFTSILR
ncbi:2-dehydro-3-deoxyphosphogluconate aldolase/(4S)-4-hydroxy-2-oxoglutarate aldolase [Arthrobacter stackebrandtii]|uniref:2-dehydro-3-deoxyphosphogluconate aldolase/(4S)-4-hydroxy-2-oxoglutarate aldolase n=1 Tax=Arthrobacter stackebrandtii TaxID=272161 RepID=A0ABS4Z1Y7_9MICC|nr:bifunctional 4-hydroxy-2-oxoglutarate aldolase/2-dehydro-3-deoxy-phosphogluconate aldolase [Arthrobacter stackebrandtii]MBP2415059.1 2-dehydro-3-deoxyphosphogluconate aldolase/(4S)-4-hydroxy-2-oxoglutarate aldolase [Arthrobacter stackebrandtii]PYH00798.1 2-dehydro-3-deoxyphosphogluconate aldolase [Arthrobacter stackebrandtii]